MEEESEYEALRRRNMARNDATLAQIGRASAEMVSTITLESAARQACVQLSRVFTQEEDAARRRC